MTEKEAFEKEQEYLRQKFYYNPDYGDKLMRFYLELTQNETMKVEIISAEQQAKLPF